jgi:hypothetical protein
MSTQRSASERIRDQLAGVQRLRAQALQAGVRDAVHTVKRLQARRFRATYRDFLRDPTRAPATRFFLEELYGDRDFSERDEQFSRIAGALERLFPHAVSELAVDLSEMHALTESLDHQLAVHWLAMGSSDLAGCSEAERYIHCWRLTGERTARERQLSLVNSLGQELDRLTRSKSLFLALKLMRRPAQAAGMASLQQVLESGFSSFSRLGDASDFLSCIGERESQWITLLFDARLDTCQRLFSDELARA